MRPNRQSVTCVLQPNDAHEVTIDKIKITYTIASSALAICSQTPRPHYHAEGLRRYRGRRYFFVANIISAAMASLMLYDDCIVRGVCFHSPPFRPWRVLASIVSVGCLCRNHAILHEWRPPRLMASAFFEEYDVEPMPMLDEPATQRFAFHAGMIQWRRRSY